MVSVEDLKKVTLVSVSVGYPPALPTGILYIGAVLRKGGYDVDIRQLRFDRYSDLDPEKMADFLSESSKVLGISCTSDTLPFIVAALGRVKNTSPGRIVILGGPGPTGVASSLIECFPFIDLVVIGEGEITILELMECLKEGDHGDLNKVKGICYREGKDVIRTTERERVQDLDSLPIPLYEAVDMTQYTVVNVVGSRGCPYHCSFCDVAPMWGRKNISRSVDSIMDELSYLRKRYGKTRFEFTDETFVIDPGKVSLLCERISMTDLKIRWACTGRLNLMTEEILKVMAEAGCEGIFYGFESASDSVLETVGKRFTIAQAVETIQTSLKYTGVVASFIWGFPFESLEDLLSTLFMVAYLSDQGVDVRLNRLTPLPLSPLFRSFREIVKFLPDEVHDAELSGMCSEVTQLVQEHQGLFSALCCYVTEDYYLKSKIVKRFLASCEASSWTDFNAVQGGTDGKEVGAQADKS